jgi:hypothetical protein
MENYENLMDELTRLNIQKQAVVKQMRDIETKLNKIKEERAAVLYNEILERISELVSLDFRIDVALWNNAIGEYEWYELEDRGNLRYRDKDTVIVD